MNEFDKVDCSDCPLNGCNPGISHGTAGAGSAFVSFGVPLLGIPSHQELLLLSQAVARADVGLGITGRSEKAQMIETMRRAVNSVGIKSLVKGAADQIVSRGLHFLADRCADALLRLMT